MRAAIFIDGGYLLQHLRSDRGMHYSKLANYVLAPLRQTFPVDLLRCYFYYCAPWMSPSPTEDELRRMEGHQSFVEHIENVSRWQVRLGKLEKRWDRDREYFEQKRVDVLLSVDLVRHSAAKHIQHAILIAGDSDFIPAVQAAKESGVTISLWCGPLNTVHRDLVTLADELHQFDWREAGKFSDGSSTKNGLLKPSKAARALVVPGLPPDERPPRRAPARGGRSAAARRREEDDRPSRIVRDDREPERLRDSDRDRNFDDFEGERVRRRDYDDDDYPSGHDDLPPPRDVREPVDEAPADDAAPKPRRRRRRGGRGRRKTTR